MLKIIYNLEMSDKFFLENMATSSSDAVPRQEILDFAHELYSFIYSKYSFGPNSLDLFADEVNLSLVKPDKGKISHFNEDIGNAVLYSQYLLREFCYSYFNAFKKYIKKSESFFNLCVSCTICECIDLRDKVFHKVLDLAAIIAEAILFCRCKENVSWGSRTSPILFTLFFEGHLKAEFIENGGWNELKDIAHKHYSYLKLPLQKYYLNFYKNKYKRISHNCELTTALRNSPVVFPATDSMYCQKCTKSSDQSFVEVCVDSSFLSRLNDKQIDNSGTTDKYFQTVNVEALKHTFDYSPPKEVSEPPKYFTYRLLGGEMVKEKGIFVKKKSGVCEEKPASEEKSRISEEKYFKPPAAEGKCPALEGKRPVLEGNRPSRERKRRTLERKRRAPVAHPPAPEVHPPAPEVNPPAAEVDPPAAEVDPPAPEVNPPAPEVNPPAPEGTSFSYHGTELIFKDKDLISIETTLISIEKALISIKKELIYIEKQYLFNEATMISKEKTIISKEKDLIEKEKAMISKENNLISKERAIISKEKSLISKEKTLISSEKALIFKEKSVSKQKILISKKKASISKEKASISKEKASISKEKASISKEKASISKEKASVSKEKASVSKEKASISKEKASISKEKVSIFKEKD